MKNWFFVLMVVLAVSCNTKEETQQEASNEAPETKEELVEYIEDKKATILVGKDKRLNRKAAQDVVKAYQRYAREYPEDIMAPEYLFQAGEVSIGLKSYKQAIAIFKAVNKRYPEFNKSPESLYMVGFIYDAHLDQRGRAKEYYEKVIDKYPDHHLAKDAEGAIKALTMTDEELIEMFKEKNS